MITRLQLTDIVTLVGFQKNPYAWMRRADLFVLSSRWEALPTVLIEAMACGTNVVATDCPSGPKEILGKEFSQHLAPVGDATALADQMRMAIAQPISAERLTDSVQRFSFQQAASQYTDLI